MRLVDQRLYLDQQRSRALLGHHHAGAGYRLPVLRQEHRRRIADPEPALGHRENAEPLTAPKRFLKARIRRKLECVSPSK